MSSRKHVLLLGLVALCSCSQKQRSPIAFNGICAPPTTATTCTFQATCGLFDLDPREGVMAQSCGAWDAKGNCTNVTGPNTLYLSMEVDNELPNNADPEVGRVNTNDANIESYTFSFTGGVSAGTVNYSVNAVVPAAGSAVTVVPVLPPEVLNEINMEMVAQSLPETEINVDIVANGHLLDGTSFSTGGYQVAVEVYQGPPQGLCDFWYCAMPTCSTAGDTLFVCPDNWGQSDTSMTCSTAL